MKLREHGAAADFLQAAMELLMENEVANNLPIGVATSLKDGRRYGDAEPIFATVEEEGACVAAFIMTPPHALQAVAKVGREEAAFSLFVEHAHSRGILAPGVVGIREQARIFADIWSERTGGNWSLKRSMRIFKLEQAIPPSGVAGSLRQADAGDLEILVDWIDAFNAELGELPGADRARKLADDLIEKRSAYLWIDDRGVPASCACNLRKIVTGEVINLVYTPPDLRGRGYASAAVAELSRRLLDRGARFCCLFADLANPVSNRLYQKIGYKPVVNYSAIDFTP